MMATVAQLLARPREEILPAAVLVRRAPHAVMCHLGQHFTIGHQAQLDRPDDGSEL